ncbi:MAG: hypothetical protein HON94_09740 [Methylococcales bacterium]|nr:hypothetical protein [Methylococcales bacterium]MBT7410731.1 hypothetical protein [Methylococcales bacterium]
MIKYISTIILISFGSLAQAGMFDRYVAIGDSISHGMQGYSVEKSRQKMSYPARLAEKMGTQFNQPYILFSGSAPNPEDKLKGNIKWYHWYYFTAPGGYRENYYDNQSELNNFSVSGATLDDLLHRPGDKNHALKVLSIDGEPQLIQALKRNPTFITITAGMNDIMNFAFLNDIESSPTPEEFRKNLDELVAKIKATSSVQGVAISNVPDIILMPVFVSAEEDGHPKGSKKMFYLKDTTGIDDAVSTPDEIAFMQARVAGYNVEIKKVAEENGWALIDLYESVKKESHQLIDANCEKTDRVVTKDYLGGVFSLDGLHPTAIGQSLFANLYISAINKTYGTTLGCVDEYKTSQNDTLYTNPVDPR